MAVQLTVTTRDLRCLFDLADPSRLREDGRLLPPSVLQDLAELVPCDDVTYQVLDPHRAQLLAFQSSANPGLDANTEPDDGDAAVRRFFWQHWWTWGCSYPERSGDYACVLRASDVESSPGAIRSLADYHRMLGVRHEILMPLPPQGPVSHRIVLWRAEGRDFTDREKLLLTLVRPHLAAIRDAALRRQVREPELTPRQRELLRLVAAGLTNRQIGRHLLISDGTVRKHLENIYAVLEVTNRTAAVARAHLLEPRRVPEADPNGRRSARGTAGPACSTRPPASFGRAERGGV